jgi:hypothetical protein
MRHSRMPVKISLEMYGEKPIVLPFFTGYVSRGLLLHVIRQVNPDLASLLHDADKPKPYSVTPLRFKAKKKDSKRNPIKRELEGIEKYRGYLLGSKYTTNLQNRRICRKFISLYRMREVNG